LDPSAILDNTITEPEHGTEAALTTAELVSGPQVGNYLLRVDRKIHFLRAALVGLLAGAVAVMFQLSLDFAERGRISILDRLHAYPDWGWIIWPVIAAVLAAIAGYITERFAPAAAGSGIPHIRAVLARKRTLEWRSLLPVKFIGGVLGLGAGLSMGREGPTVQLGAAVGAALGEQMKLDQRSRRNLIASAAGAGLGAAFNAPLAGFIFVIEELQRELSPLTFVSALIASVTSVAISRIFTGQLPSFHIHNFPLPPLQALPLFAVMGVVAGYAGVFYNYTIIRSVRFSKSLPLTTWQKGAIAGVITGLAGWWLPEALGGGHRIAERLLLGEFATPDIVWFLLVLLIGKFALSMIAYASGLPGGIFAPLLVLGAIIGTLFGQISVVLFPHTSATPAAYAVIGMAALFTSIVRAPLTGIVLILEMTGNQEQLFALILACLISYLIAENARSAPVYDALLDLDLEKDTGIPAEGKPEPFLFLITVGSHSIMDGALIRDLKLPPNTVFISVRRSGDELIATGNLELMAGDHVLVAAHRQNEEEIKGMASLH
jgi:chloride channel protein, CIC family